MEAKANPVRRSEIVLPIAVNVPLNGSLACVVWFTCECIGYHASAVAVLVQRLAEYWHGDHCFDRSASAPAQTLAAATASAAALGRTFLVANYRLPVPPA